MQTAYSSIEIVLVRPDGDANIGAVCRAMKSMGFASLTLVFPEERAVDEEIVATWALSARDIYHGARTVSSLEEALSSSSWSVGLTRRTGMRRTRRVVAVEEMAAEAAARAAAGARTALVFGNEATGLTREELEACSLAATIETDPAFPSLNLSHAVQLVCYLMRRALPGAVPATESGIGRTAAVELAEEITADLREIGFFTLVDADPMIAFFRDLMQRGNLSGEEARYFRALFAKIRGLKLHRP